MWVSALLFSALQKCLIFYVLDSRGGHFGNMLIKEIPPPLLNVIMRKCNLEVLRIPKM